MEKKTTNNQRHSSIFYFLFSGLILFSIFYFLASGASAQALPEFMVTWKASNYAPSDYPGKVLPIGDTKIDLALELIDGGKLVDLSRFGIQWLINGDTLRSGRGLKITSFNAGSFNGSQVVDLTIQNYRGADLVHRLVIPSADPEVAIIGGPETFQAIPYFFNISSPRGAQYIWTANGNAVLGSGDDPDIISLDLKDVPAGNQVNLNVTVQNLLKPLEIASRAIQLTR